MNNSLPSQCLFNKFLCLNKYGLFSYCQKKILITTVNSEKDDGINIAETNANDSEQRNTSMTDYLYSLRRLNPYNSSIDSLNMKTKSKIVTHFNYIELPFNIEHKIYNILLSHLSNIPHLCKIVMDYYSFTLNGDYFTNNNNNNKEIEYYGNKVNASNAKVYFHNLKLMSDHIDAMSEYNRYYRSQIYGNRDDNINNDDFGDNDISNRGIGDDASRLYFVTSSDYDRYNNVRRMNKLQQLSEEKVSLVNDDKYGPRLALFYDLNENDKDFRGFKSLVSINDEKGKENDNYGSMGENNEANCDCECIVAQIPYFVIVNESKDDLDSWQKVVNLNFAHLFFNS